MGIHFNWIEGLPNGRLAIMPRPNGGVYLMEDMAALKLKEVDVFVSLLTGSEVESFDLTEEDACCRANEMVFLSYPIRDHSVPVDNADTREFILNVNEHLQRGESVVAHCFAGIGRSSLLAASLMVVQGFRVEDAFERIARARGLTVPDTIDQLDWVQQFARSLRPGG